MALLGKKNILWCEIAMNDVLLVCSMHRLTHLLDDAEHLINRHGCVEVAHN
jgi:hypothetical protein